MSDLDHIQPRDDDNELIEVDGLLVERHNDRKPVYTLTDAATGAELARRQWLNINDGIPVSTSGMELMANHEGPAIVVELTETGAVIHLSID